MPASYGLTFDRVQLLNFLKDRIVIDKETDCWNWAKAIDQFGYGIIPIENKRYRAHHLSAYIWLDYKLDSGFRVKRTCNSLPCINPEHLFVDKHKSKIGKHSLDKKYLSKLLKESCTVDPQTGCWLWERARDLKRGYGGISIMKKDYSPHRLSAYVWLGLNLNNHKMQACHKCDTPQCISPKHLFVGTQSDNIKDCYKKGRLVDNSGSKCAAAKLHESDIPTIRQLLKEQSANKISKLYSVRPGAILDIKKGRTWKHVQ